jgi:drug/metabolite transporter (DMT)-like permease
MNPILLLALIPPLLWAAGNHGDKYSVDRFMRGRNPGSLIIFTAIAAVLFALGIFIFYSIPHVPIREALAIIASGVVLILSYIPYVHALKGDEATNTASLFQLVTPCVYVLGIIFLGEHLPFLKLCAGSLVFVGAIILSFDFKHLHIRRRTLLLMVLASVMIASNVVAFKFFGLRTDFWTTAFYDMIGTTIGGIFLACIPDYRRDFVSSIREFKYKVIGLSMAIEASGIFSRLLFGFITLAVPAALVQFVNGLQPMFIMIFGIVLTKWAPHLGQEEIDRHSLVRKFSAILIMLLGLVLLVA